MLFLAWYKLWPNTKQCGSFHSVILNNIFMWNKFILEICMNSKWEIWYFCDELDIVKSPKATMKSYIILLWLYVPARKGCNNVVVQILKLVQSPVIQVACYFTIQIQTFVCVNSLPLPHPNVKSAKWWRH